MGRTTHRRGRLAAVGLVAVATLVALPAAPALGGEVDGQNVVYAGSYFDGFFDSQLAAGLNGRAGKNITFGGKFHVVDESKAQRESGNPFRNTIAMLEESWKAGATPFSNIEVKAPAVAIAAGRHDADINAWVGDVKAWLDRGEMRSLIVAPLQEMNGSWTPYGCDPGNYKAAYRKFVDAFRNAGIGPTQVRFAWAPNGWTSPGCGGLRDYYPGDDVVDIVSISAYNFGTRVGTVWSSVFATMGGAFNELRTFAGSKPFMLAQTAACPQGGDKGAWAVEMFKFAAADPNVIGFVWFNFDKECDFRLDPIIASWTAGMQLATTKYEWPLKSLFTTDPITVKTTPPPPTIDPCPATRTCGSLALVDAGPRFHIYNQVRSDARAAGFFFGNPGDFPLMGDWDCNGTKTPGMYRNSTGLVYLRNSNTSGSADIRFFFGDPGDLPLVGDFNGDGCDTVSIYRSSTAQIFIVNRLGQSDGGLGAADASYSFGNVGDRPFVGDFDGDGIDTVGLHRESTGLVYFNNQHASRSADNQFVFGDPGDSIVASDWNGDGTDSPALYRPSTGEVFIKFTNSAGVADLSFFAGFNFVGALPASRA